MRRRWPSTAPSINGFWSEVLEKDIYFSMPFASGEPQEILSIWAYIGMDVWEVGVCCLFDRDMNSRAVPRSFTAVFFVKSLRAIFIGLIFSRRGLQAEHHAVLHMIYLWVKPCGLHGNKLVLKVLQHLAAVTCEQAQSRTEVISPYA